MFKLERQKIVERLIAISQRMSAAKAAGDRKQRERLIGHADKKLEELWAVMTPIERRANRRRAGLP